MNLKREAASHAVNDVRSGMVVGLGTGSTTAYFITMLGERIRSGVLQGVRAVPTSEVTAKRARELGIPLTTLAECSKLDMAVDGADEVDPRLNLIKGLGRALLREKMVETHAKRFVVVVDEAKIVPQLGRGPLPIEIILFEAEAQVHWLNTLGCRAELWHEESGVPIKTDNGNYLVRCWFEGGITDAYELSRTLSDRPGVVEHGLFLDMANQVIVAGLDGIRILERS